MTVFTSSRAKIAPSIILSLMRLVRCSSSVLTSPSSHYSPGRSPHGLLRRRKPFGPCSSRRLTAAASFVRHPISHPSRPGRIRPYSHICAMIPSDDWIGPTGTPGSVQHLLSVSLRACHIMTPFVRSIYGSIGRSTAKEKADASAFTIADGMVQHLLTDYLYGGGMFEVVGEEDCSVDLGDENPNVDGLVIPIAYRALLSETVREISCLKDHLQAEYPEMTVFIDPIDGTKEFTSGKGEQCSICIGFASRGSPVGGLVFRPLTSPATYAMGCRGEKFVASYLLPDEGAGGLLTSNGGISPFLVGVMDRTKWSRIPAGGAGNKMLRLLENEDNIYVLDRGLSRWDTCAASAVIEANGGYVGKLSSYMRGDADDYTYTKAELNSDFEEGLAKLTKYNNSFGGEVTAKNGQIKAINVEEVKPYANLCGLVAMGPKWNNEKSKDEVLHVLQKVSKMHAPSYD